MKCIYCDISPTLDQLEEKAIRNALKKHNNLTRAAKELGIGIATLYRKIYEYNIQGYLIGENK